MSGFDLLEQRIKSTAIQGFVIAGVTLIIGLGLVALGIFQALSGPVGQAVFIVVLGVVAALASWMILQNTRKSWPAREAKLYRVLAGDATSVLWAHQIAGKTNGIQIYLRDEGQHTLYANDADAKALMMLVRERAPHAILGYGQEQKARYEQLVKQGGVTA